MVRQLLRAGRRAPSLWRRYWGLPASRRAALWRAAAWVVIVRVSLQVFPFRRILTVVENQSRAHLDRSPRKESLRKKKDDPVEKASRAREATRQRSREHARCEAERSFSAGQDPGESAATATPFKHWRYAQQRSEESSPEPRVSQPAVRPAMWYDAEVERTLWAVRATGRRLLPERPCLTQALVGRFLLAQHGLDASIQIGVTKEESDLKAHAWLEHEGTIILGGAQSRDKYQPFPALDV